MAREDFRNLYQDLLIDHSRERHGFGLEPHHSAESHQRNRSCGDDVTLRVHMTGEGIERISWSGQGCSISQASASMLADLVAGGSVAQFAQRLAAFRAMLQSRGKDGGSEEILGDAVALCGVALYPPRINCAMLAWTALEDALGQLPDAPPSTTENTR